MTDSVNENAAGACLLDPGDSSELLLYAILSGETYRLQPGVSPYLADAVVPAPLQRMARIWRLPLDTGSDGLFTVFLVEWKPGARSELVVAFRGSYSLDTLLVNANPLTVGLAHGACVHRGYYDHYSRARWAVMRVARSFAGGYQRVGGRRRITVVGHSLGGCCASLCAWDLAVLGMVGESSGGVRLATYGSPPFGSRRFCEVLEAALVPEGCFRVVNPEDPVPDLRIRFWAHAGKPVNLQRDASMCHHAGHGIAAYISKLESQLEAQIPAIDRRRQPRKVEPPACFLGSRPKVTTATLRGMVARVV